MKNSDTPLCSSRLFLQALYKKDEATQLRAGYFKQ